VNYELAQSLKNKIFCSYIENEWESVNPMIETCEYEIDTQSYGIDIIEADIE
jgi:hypothetical protein